MYDVVQPAIGLPRMRSPYRLVQQPGEVADPRAALGESGQYRLGALRLCHEPQPGRGVEDQAVGVGGPVRPQRLGRLGPFYAQHGGTPRQGSGCADDACVGSGSQGPFSRYENRSHSP
jgi:hypothetical protein